MKILSKHVLIENEDHVLIKGEYDGRVYYGTIPYSEIDETGRLKRMLNGLETAIIFVDEVENPVAEAILFRKRRILMDKFRQEGHTDEEIIEYMKKLWEEVK